MVDHPRMTERHPEQTVEAVAARLRAGGRLLAITGAGISADSGLPTYRGIGGLYEQDDTEEGMPVEQALSGETFAHAPALTWRHIAQIEQACRGAYYNAAHRVLADLEAVCQRVCVLTQNVDGFHTAAGSSEIIEMHGDVHELHCTSCDFAERVADYSGLSTIPPYCPACGSLVRPRVVLFGEMLPETAVARYEDALADEFDVIMAIGTTAVFPYIAAPVLQAGRSGATTVEINPDVSELSHRVEHRIPQGAATALSSLWEAVSRPG